jgi:pyruvyltransferase
MTINVAFCASTTQKPYSNFGDGLSGLIVALMSGQKVNHADFKSDESRIAAIGTILQNLDKGHVDVWGTGLDIRIGHSGSFYNGPHSKETTFNIHSVRGRLTAAHLETIGFDIPRLYGDPALLLKIFLQGHVNPFARNRNKIGLVCHLTEFEDYTPVSKIKAERKRYHGLNPDEFSIINPLVDPNPSAILNKVYEISSYGYILTTSLHGMIIADAFGIPSGILGQANEIGLICNLDFDKKIDHRFRDYHSGLGLPWSPVYSADISRPIDYKSSKDFLDSLPSKQKFIDQSINDLVESFPVSNCTLQGKTKEEIESLSIKL